jgi:hypothetical protein
VPRADDRATLERLLKKNAEQRGTIEYLKLQNEALDEKDFVGRRGKAAIKPKTRKLYNPRLYLVHANGFSVLSRIRAH